MIISAHRVALVLIPLLAGLGLLALAWSQLFGDLGDLAVPLPPPLLSTQSIQPTLPNLPPALVGAPDTPIITIAATPYRHPSGAFTINYPDGWQIDESEDSAQFTAPDEGAAQLSVTFTSSPAATADEQSEYERDLRQTWGDLPAFAIQNLDPDQMPERWSATFNFSQTMPPHQTATPMIGVSIYWLRDKVRYNFVALVAAESWNQIETVLQSIANSLQTYPNLATIESE